MPVILRICPHPPGHQHTEILPSPKGNPTHTLPPFQPHAGHQILASQRESHQRLVNLHVVDTQRFHDPGRHIMSTCPQIQVRCSPLQLPNPFSHAHTQMHQIFTHPQLPYLPLQRIYIIPQIYTARSAATIPPLCDATAADELGRGSSSSCCRRQLLQLLVQGRQHRANSQPPCQLYYVNAGGAPPCCAAMLLDDELREAEGLALLGYVAGELAWAKNAFLRGTQAIGEWLAGGVQNAVIKDGR